MDVAVEMYPRANDARSNSIVRHWYYEFFFLKPSPDQFIARYISSLPNIEY